jgi:hypothetical protein
LIQQTTKDMTILKASTELNERGIINSIKGEQGNWYIDVTYCRDTEIRYAKMTYPNVTFKKEK